MKAPSHQPIESTHDGARTRSNGQSQDGDGCLGECSGGGDDDDGDGDASQVASSAGQTTANSNSTMARQVKRKNPKKKKKPKNKAALVQSSPPRVPLGDLFLANDYAV